MGLLGGSYPERISHPEDKGQSAEQRASVPEDPPHLHLKDPITHKSHPFRINICNPKVNYAYAPL